MSILVYLGLSPEYTLKTQTQKLKKFDTQTQNLHSKNI